MKLGQRRALAVALKALKAVPPRVRRAALAGDSPVRAEVIDGT
jgi:hypothetical protein